MVAISPTQSNAQAAIKSFLAAVLPNDVIIISGLQNRVPEPVNGRFAVMTPIIFKRLGTNYDSSQDCKIVGSISGALLTVAEVLSGEINVGSTVFGTGVAVNTTITGQQSASTYTVSVPQTVASSTLSCGQKTMLQSAELTVQLDFHTAGADTSGSDLAQTVSTSLRDEFGVDFFGNLPSPQNSVFPLYADDPKMVPFINAENAYEWRWSLDAKFEVLEVVSVPQQYADAVDVTLVDVDAVYPP